MALIDCVIVTCEHASRRVPSRYRALFRGQEAVLKTHRGSDLGALRLARELATALEAPLFAGSVSRLLIDLNRSLHHVQLYSAITRACPENDRRRLAAPAEAAPFCTFPSIASRRFWTARYGMPISGFFTIPGGRWNECSAARGAGPFAARRLSLRYG